MLIKWVTPRDFIMNIKILFGGRMTMLLPMGKYLVLQTSSAEI